MAQNYRNPYTSPSDPVPAKRIEAQEPTEEPRADWIPYRGSEQHGVMQTEPIPYPDEDYAEDIQAELQAEIKAQESQEAEIEPIPVTIVFDRRPKFDTHWRVTRYPVNAGNVTLILGRNDRRTQAVIKVMTGSISISHEQGAAFMGYPLAEGETITMDSIEEVWCTATTDANIAVLQTYVVDR